MACDAQSVETLLVNTDKYYSLSHRQWLEWLVQLVINAAGLTVTAAIDLAATRKMAALSDRNLEECRIAVFTAALYDAQNIINEIATQKYPSLDRHDLMCATIAAYCAGVGGSAQTVETLSVGNGYFKLSQRNDTLAIDAVICAANSLTCTNITAVALSNGITGMSERHLKEVFCAAANSLTCSTPTITGAAGQPDLVSIVVTWSVPPASVSYTEVWTSPDNITFTLTDAVAAPGATSTIPVLGANTYVKLRFCSGTIPTFPLTAAWATQVVSNGGAAPSAATKASLQIFETQISTLTSRIWHLNPIAPDSLIAALTPLIHTNGAALWTKHTGGSPPAESITTEGLKGANDSTNGTLYDLGFAPNGVASYTTGNFGMSLYVSAPVLTSSSHDVSGSYDGTTSAVGIQVDNGGNVLGIAYSVPVRIQVAHAQVGGFFSLNRTATTSLIAYFASSITAWASFGTQAGANAVAPGATGLMCCGEQNPALTYLPNPERVSFLAYHDGFSSADGQILFNAVQALRVNLGGGYR